MMFFLYILGTASLSATGLNLLSGSLLRRYSDNICRWFSGNPHESLAAGIVSGTSSAALRLLMAETASGKLKPLKGLQAVAAVHVAGAMLYIIAAALFYLPALSGLLLFAFIPFLAAPGTSVKKADLLTGLALLILSVQLYPFVFTIPLINEGVLQTIRMISGHHAGLVLAFLFGLFITVMLRSSLGLIIMLMALARYEILPLAITAAAAAGSGVGLSLSLLILSVRLSTDSTRLSVFYLLLQLCSSLLLLIFYPVLRVNFEIFLTLRSFVPVSAPVLLALMLTVVYILPVLILLPFYSWILSVISLIVRNNTLSDSDLNLPRILPEAIDANLAQTRSGLAEMAAGVHSMLMKVMNNASQLNSGDDEFHLSIEEQRTHMTELRNRLSQALATCVQQACSPDQAWRIQQQQRIAHELKGIADDCYRIVLVLAKSRKKNYRFHSDSESELFGFAAQVLDFLQYNSDYLHGRISVFDTAIAAEMEAGIDKGRDSLKKRARKYLEKDSDAQVKGELAFIEVVAHLEHIGDSCMHISRRVSTLNKAGVVRS
ncbi:Na/Pi cotransporter family protein [Spirochaeta dissipatitropha]